MELIDHMLSQGSDGFEHAEEHLWGQGWPSAPITGCELSSSFRRWRQSRMYPDKKTK